MWEIGLQRLFYNLIQLRFRNFEWSKVAEFSII